MTNLDSSVPAAVTGLLADLTTVSADAGLLATLQSTLGSANTPQIVVIDGQLGTNVPPIYVAVVGVTNWQQQTRDGGNLRRDEEYDIEGVIWAADGGDGVTDSSPLRSCAFSILSKIVQQVTADYTLGGAVRFASLHSAAMTQGVVDPGGWACQVEFSIGCAVALER